MLDEAEGQDVVGVTQASLQLANSAGSTSTERFFQFRSVCAGAPAPEGQTAGEDGSCVALDVETVVDDASLPLPGGDEEDPCFDVTAAFAGAVPSDAAPTPEGPLGACSVPVPAQVGSRWNVALRRDGVQRPLPVGLAARADTSRAVFVPSVCAALASGAQLVFAATTSPWRGDFGVCAPWNSAKEQTTDGATLDGGLPDMTLPDVTLPDATLPDVTLPDAPFSDVEIGDALPDVELPDVVPPPAGAARHSLTAPPPGFTLLGLASAGAEVVLVGQVASMSHVLREPLFAALSGSSAYPATVGVGFGVIPKLLRLGATDHFYLQLIAEPWDQSFFLSASSPPLAQTLAVVEANRHFVQFAPNRGAMRCPGSDDIRLHRLPWENVQANVASQCPVPM